MNPRKLDMTQDQEAIRKALARFVQSPSMAGSERLRDFMSYIVEESLAGRGADIRGKTIAQDLYPKSGTSHENRDNLVRVDAGRLRRKLADYYAGPGANDPLRLHLDKGGYMPWCEEISPSPTPQAEPIWHRITARAAWAAAALAGIGALAVMLLTPAAPIPAPPPEAAPQSGAHRQARMAEREALLAKSPATLHAANLCEIGRGLLFPIAEPGNQITAQETFRQAISRDPSYACGYAGLAHSLSTTSLLQPPGAAKDAMMQEAVQSAQAAVERDPTSGWSQSALAWAHFTSGALEAAMRHSALAEQLSPNDGNVLDF
ncbi:MAG: hypothetical protein OIF40_00855, partial [Mangrovicoccus sp.]|nr:hypothetical protein [Mangrovicoccus sp.]